MLLPQSLLNRPFRGDCALSCCHQLLFVAAAIRCFNKDDTNAEKVAILIAMLTGVRNHLHFLAAGIQNIDGEFVEEPLNSEKRADVRLIIDATRDVEEVAKPPSYDCIEIVTAPFEERIVDALYISVRMQRKIAARSVLKHVFKVEPPAIH